MKTARWVAMAVGMVLLVIVVTGATTFVPILGRDGFLSWTYSPPDGKELQEYRIESAPTPDGPWSTVQDHLTPSGPMSVQVSPPMDEVTSSQIYFRVVAKLLNLYSPFAVIRLAGDLDFGEVDVGAGAERALTIHNDGDALLTVSGIEYPPAFSGAWNGTIAAGCSTNVTVTFSPPAEGGYGGTITVLSDATEGTNTIACSGTGISALPPPEGMVLIPGGSFTMGDTFNDWQGNLEGTEETSAELPPHVVYVSSFYMDQYEVTWTLWTGVYAWAVSHGYTFGNEGAGKAGDHPVHSIYWSDMVKWCNARSEKEGLTPTYYTSAEQTTVYREGQLDIANDWVNWAADGYRLPTEAEWEKAAHGGVSGHRFPWSDSDEIQHARANYHAADAGENIPRPDYDTSETTGYHPDYAQGDEPYTSPVGSFAPNGYGLYDMAGNVAEACWDLFDADYYDVSPSSDPRGPDGVDFSRAVRGGSWSINAYVCRVAGRFSWATYNFYNDIGFRTVRAVGSMPPPSGIIRLSGDLDFGEVVSGTSTQRTLTIHNDGEGSLTVASMNYPEAFSGAWSGTIDAGSSTNVTVTFSPYAEGVFSGTIRVVSDAPGGTNTIACSGTGIASGSPTEGMVLIPAGDFWMGDLQSEGAEYERPPHRVYVGEFAMDKCEVTKVLWDEVYAWAVNNGYAFENIGSGKATNHPVHTVNWYDMVKWCNARSEKEGLTPAYYTSSGQKAVYREGQLDLSNDCVNWAANGYRLPTEAEWEKAAYGGWDLFVALSGGGFSRFPWSDSGEIQHTRANYYSSEDYGYDTSETRGYHPDYAVGETPYTAPIGSFAPNGFGLYDMAGNVGEACWDRFETNYYRTYERVNPHGAEPGEGRMLRGGGWVDSAYCARAVYRLPDSPAGDKMTSMSVGFRTVRGRADRSIRLTGHMTFWAAAGASQQRTLTIWNIGTLPLTVTSVSYPEHFSGANWIGVLAPGDTTNLAVTFSPPAEGNYGGMITVASDANAGSNSMTCVGTGWAAGPPAPEGMALIPAGLFAMGDCMGDSAMFEFTWELPVHDVFLSSFYMDKYEVTSALWDDVYSWATNNGYSFDNPGLIYNNGEQTFTCSQGQNHPVMLVNWYDMVKWCNARSEKEGLTPTYYTSAEQTTVYREGQLDIANDWVNWAADGYRLPTEAEWEKAARGGASGRRFAWSDSDEIDHSRANYYAYPGFVPWDTNPTMGMCFDFLPDVIELNQSQLFLRSPVGSYAPNGYGLFDMIGNADEACWDWWGYDYYSSSPRANPHGPASSEEGRTLRGIWYVSALYGRAASRVPVNPSSAIGCGWGGIGFRTVRTAGTEQEESGGIIRLSGDLDFGEVLEGGDEERTLTLYNDGDEPLTVTSINYPEGFSGAWSGVIAAGESTNITVTFSPPKEGSYGGSVTVVSDAIGGTNTIACSGTGYSLVPKGMALIPAGSFIMGDWFEDGLGEVLDLGGDATEYVGAEPLHPVFVSSFYMDKREVSKALWDEVYSWATNHGYSFGFEGAGKETNHPVHSVNWYDAVKWCNARSEKEGLTPAYYTSTSKTTVYREDQLDLASDCVDWTADGYRLPTEAEWEKAARGGAPGRRFPWNDSDEIQHARANYLAHQEDGIGVLFGMGYDTSPTSGFHPDYYEEDNEPYTSPGGSFAPNGYGLYDMAGNVFEWCWDAYDPAYIHASPYSNPRGPSEGDANRVIRGGAYSQSAWFCRVASRIPFMSELVFEGNADFFGFRTVRMAGLEEDEGARIIRLSGDLDFGEVPTYGSAQRTLTIHNDGDTKLCVTAIEQPEDFSCSPTLFEIAGGCSTSLAVTFLPRAQTNINGIITVYSDATDGTNAIVCSGTGGKPYAAPEGMARIPAGSFVMGDAFDDISPYAPFYGETPLHTVYVSSFFMDKNEVTKALWDEVYAWAITNGYSFDNPGAGKAANHPVQTINWYDMVKWCNARSEKEGLRPAYYTSYARAAVYRAGRLSLGNSCVDWLAEGYRLPTEAEWEKAARGGASGRRFPWSHTDTIRHTRANYLSYNPYGWFLYDTSETFWFHPDYDEGDMPYTSPVGSFAPNGYGLYDMAGNVFEACWDGMSTNYYSYSPTNNPHGFNGGPARMVRGGSWSIYAYFCRVSSRWWMWAYTNTALGNLGLWVSDLGFRTVRLSGVPVGGTIRLSGDLDFGEVEAGSNTLRTLTIHNDGDVRMDVDSISYPDGFSGAWSGIIAAGRSTNVTMTFSPWAAGNYGGTITVASTATAGTNTIDCSGTGLSGGAPPEGMVLVPAGGFIMGDAFGDAAEGETPTHAVSVGAFYMDRYEVSKALWDEVYEWAATNGYSFDHAGSGKATNHPVHTVSWYDAVKWCNARSEREGLTPAYYTSGEQTTVYRSGQVGLENAWVNWTADGYRLPTEAEWEKAARGGASGRRFPWSDADTIQHARANYDSSLKEYFTYDTSLTDGLHPDYAGGDEPHTSPVGSFASNGYEIYDMAGNVGEWCWDWYGEEYYDGSPGTDPRGPSSGTERVCRGGFWADISYYCRAAGRLSFPPAELSGALDGMILGFRTVRTSP